MATIAPLTVEQYLKNCLSEDYPPEFVHGELVYRSIPKWLHSRLQHLLSVPLHQAGLLCAPELHLRIADDLIRIADIAVYRDAPGQEIPSTPPFVVVEIVSPDDRHQQLLQKLADYDRWGVANIWIVEPLLKSFHVYRDGSLKEVSCFELSEYGVRVDASIVFAEINGR